MLEEARHERVLDEGLRVALERLWRIKVPSKIKMFRRILILDKLPSIKQL